MSKTWLEGRIVGKKQWTERLFSLQLNAPLDTFSAGQFVQVALDVKGERIGRPYSLVNAPSVRPLEIYFNEVDEGPLTPKLSELNPGDLIWVKEKASGAFTLERVPDCQDLWLFASGTALGVYLSMLGTDIPWQRFENIYLIHGARTSNEIAYRETIDRFAERYPDKFRFISVLSREHGNEALHGRITSRCADGTLEQKARRTIGPHRSHVMLCGNSAMIDDMRTLLESRAMVRNTIRTTGHYTTEQYH